MTRTRAIESVRSAANPLLERFRRALGRGELTPDGCLAVEGRHLVEAALRSPAQVEAVLAAESAREVFDRLPALRNGRARRIVLPDKLFRRLAETEAPQGVAALVRLPEWKLESVLASPQPRVAVLVELQDPGNLGTILRTLEALGGAACLLTPRTVSPFNAKAARASAGALFRLPVLRHIETDELLARCRAKKLATIGLAPRGGRPLTEVNLTRGFVFFVGQEGAGLDAALLAQVDIVATIPLAAAAESLNAAVAASLLLYEAARQRGFRR